MLMREGKEGKPTVSGNPLLSMKKVVILTGLGCFLWSMLCLFGSRWMQQWGERRVQGMLVAGEERGRARERKGRQE
jgi:hypothetical protein